jgi:flagellar protein FlaF
MSSDSSAMFADPRQAYDTAMRTSVSGRELEARALSKAARQLEECMQDWDSPGRAERLDQAIRFNQRLWTFFQTELARPDHPLPVELRVNLLRLSQFIDRRSFDVTANPNPSALKALVDLNRQMAEALRTGASAEDPAPK